MANYYFLGTSLSPIAIGAKPAITFRELIDLLRANLTPADWHKVSDLLLLIDLSNIRALWMGSPFDERGQFTSNQLEDAILVKEGLPEPVLAYLERYETVEDRLRFFPALYTALFQGMQEKYPSGFLHQYYALEREIRLVLTALRAKRFGRDVVRELQFEDPSDPFAKEILAQKDAAEYTPPPEYVVLKTIFQRCAGDPKELYRALLEYRFQKIEELEEGESFSIDAILGYVARLILVESWDQLDEPKGIEIIEHLSR